MTLEQLLAREAIRDTMANCNVAGDRLKADDYAACFTEDGIIQSERAPGDFIFRYAGREAIRDWQNRWRSREPGPDTAQGASFVRHNLSTCKIDLTGSAAATARTYWVAWTDIGPDHSGIYLDDFRKVGEDWLISLRRVRRDWSAPDSLFVTTIAKTSEG
jgi:hypothetical protein